MDSNPDQQAVLAIKAKIMREMQLRRRGVSFVELRNAVGESFNGDWLMVASNDYPNIVLWFGLSRAALTALRELLEEGVITMRPTTPLVYMADGAMPNVPIAKQRRKYKTERWLPVVFNLTAQGKA